MAKGCCCYFTDSGYLLPTLLSAVQARRALDGELADIIVFYVGKSCEASVAFEQIYTENGILFRPLDPKSLGGLPIHFGRFHLHTLLDSKYGPVIYMDGDTQIADSLQPLLNANIEPGRFLAARDPMAISIDGWATSKPVAYLKSIGLSIGAAGQYCNSGVLRFDLADWGEISERVLDVSSANRHGYAFPDQDPLNILFAERYMTMSYKWNFPSFFLGLGFGDFITPRVLHFMSNPRPWDGPFHPWGRPHFLVYTQLVERFPTIKKFWKRLNHATYLKYHMQQHYKRVMESPQWSTRRVREHIMSIENASVV